MTNAMRRKLLCLFFFGSLLLGTSPVEAKLTLAVVDFQDYAGGSGVRLVDAIRRGVTDMLVTELFNSRLFTIVERTRLEEVAREQRLAMQGLTDPGKAAQVGRLLGANAILLGNITQFALKEYVTPGNPDRVGFASIDVRVVDVESGAVLFVARGEGKADRIKGANYFRDATQVEQEGQGILSAAALDAVRQVVKRLCFDPSLVKSFPVLGGPPRVKIEAGATNGGVKRGELFLVYQEGEPILGLDGSVIDVERCVIAVVKVVSVQPRYSVCELYSGDGDIQRGDFAMRVSEEELAGIEFVKRANTTP